MFVSYIIENNGFSLCNLQNKSDFAKLQPFLKTSVFSHLGAILMTFSNFLATAAASSEFLNFG